MFEMALTVATFNLKGGTGKTTAVSNLGACLAMRQRPKLRILLIDLDGQRTLSYSLGFDGHEPTALDWLSGDAIAPVQTNIKRLDLVPGDIGMFLYRPASGTVNNALKHIPDEYDLILLDCPPSLTEISSQALLSCDRVLLPTICQPACLKGVGEAINLIRGDAPNKPIDLLRVWYEGALVLTQEADTTLESSAKTLDYNFLKNPIPKNVRIAEAVAHHQPVVEYSPRSAGAKAFKDLARECTNLWGLK